MHAAIAFAICDSVKELIGEIYRSIGAAHTLVLDGGGDCRARCWVHQSDSLATVWIRV